MFHSNPQDRIVATLVFFGAIGVVIAISVVIDFSERVRDFITDWFKKKPTSLKN